jgi:hypothetical protein
VKPEAKYRACVHLGESQRGGGASESLLLLLLSLPENDSSAGESESPSKAASTASAWLRALLLFTRACAAGAEGAAAAAAGGEARQRPTGRHGRAASGLLGGLLRLLPEVGGEFGGAPPSLSSENESGHCFSGGGPSSESEGHPLSQRQKRRRRCV